MNRSGTMKRYGRVVRLAVVVALVVEISAMN